LKNNNLQVILAILYFCRWDNDIHG
jgi:hypothetical protein